MLQRMTTMKLERDSTCWCRKKTGAPASGCRSWGHVRRALGSLMSVVVLLALFVIPLGGCATRESASAKAVLSMPRSGFVNVEGGRVWYTIVGDGRETPLLILHGGPGAPHDYLNNLGAFGKDRPVIFYDQLGCGKSDLPDDNSLWTRERFVRELATVRENLQLKECYILGQSWGTFLAADYLLTQPKGVRGVVFSSSCLSIPRTSTYMRKLIDELPPKARDTIIQCEQSGKTDSPEYQEAVGVFYHKHLCRMDPWPDDLNHAFEGLGEKVYGYMNGPSEFSITGTIKDADVTSRLSEIAIPALFVTGQYDEVPPEGAAEDAARMPHATAVVIPDSSHMCHLEKPDEFQCVVGNWLRKQDVR